MTDDREPGLLSLTKTLYGPVFSGWTAGKHSDICSIAGVKDDFSFSFTIICPFSQTYTPSSLFYLLTFEPLLQKLENRGGGIMHEIGSGISVWASPYKNQIYCDNRQNFLGSTKLYQDRKLTRKVKQGYDSEPGETNPCRSTSLLDTG